MAVVLVLALTILLSGVVAANDWTANMKSEDSPAGFGADGSPSSRPGPRPIGNGTEPEETNHGTWLQAKPMVALANLAVCRARRKNAGGFVYCLVSNAYACPFAERVDYNLLCCHPEKENIILRTEAKRHK